MKSTNKKTNTNPRGHPWPSKIIPSMAIQGTIRSHRLNCHQASQQEKEEEGSIAVCIYGFMKGFHEKCSLEEKFFVTKLSKNVWEFFYMLRVLDRLGPKQLCPGAHLSGSQLSALKNLAIGPRTVGPQGILFGAQLSRPIVQGPNSQKLDSRKRFLMQ